MKIVCVMLTGMMALAFCAVALAQEKTNSMMGADMTQGKTMDEKGMPGGQEIMCSKDTRPEMHPMEGMMMKTMMDKSLVASDDGGVIVLIGNKLMKYDKKLNLVKEVEIPLDMEAMQKNMTKMMKNSRMMKGSMTEDVKQAN